jgi:hypothetical protein
MYLRKIVFSVFLLYSFAVTAMAQNQTIEYGSADELKDIEKVFVDTKADMAVRDRIIAEIRKNLRSGKRDLKIVSKPEDSDIHLRFYYETQTVNGGAVNGGTVHSGPYPGVMIVKIPVGMVMKILGEDRVRLLMSYDIDRGAHGIRINWSWRKPEAEFARKFVKEVVGR